MRLCCVLTLTLCISHKDERFPPVPLRVYDCHHKDGNLFLTYESFGSGQLWRKAWLQEDLPWSPAPAARSSAVLSAATPQPSGCVFSPSVPSVPGYWCVQWDQTRQGRNSCSPWGQGRCGKKGNRRQTWIREENDIVVCQRSYPLFFQFACGGRVLSKWRSSAFIRTYVQFLPPQHIFRYLSYGPILKCSPLCGQQATQTHTYTHWLSGLSVPDTAQTSGWKNTGLIRTVPCFPNINPGLILT